MWRELRYRTKRGLCYLTIIILLPYIITVFLNGPSILSVSHVDGTQILVQAQDNENISMSIEEYCIGIMAKCIPADYEMEALKAQAVLVRTEVYRKIQSEGSSSIFTESFWSRQQMEDNWGAVKYASYHERLKKAWEDTEGIVLVYEEQLARVPYFRLSNGSTRDGREVLGSEDYPYLKIKECPLDIEDAKQIQTITIDDMDVEVTASDTAGYVTEVRVGEERISGEEFRTNYQLTSSCFTLQKYEGKLRITTRGIGHGLGMSQNTANEMAKEKKKMEEILQYFFEGCEEKEVADIVKIEEESE